MVHMRHTVHMSIRAHIDILDSEIIEVLNATGGMHEWTRTATQYYPFSDYSGCVPIAG